MDLTNPSALWYLILLVIPLLLARRRAPRVRRAVSNLYLWRELARRDPARLSIRRLRRNWLVALQIALMGAIIVALAGPVVACRAARVALVVDLSMSMGARDGVTTRLGLAREHARAILRGMAPDTIVRLIAAKSTPRDLGEQSAGALATNRVLDALTPTGGSANLPAAIRLASTGEAAVQHVYVLSDRAWRDAPDLVSPAGPAVTWEQVGHDADNLAVARIAARRLPLAQAGGQVLVEIRNYSSHARETEVEIAQDGQLIGRQSVHVPARGAQAILQDVMRLGHLVSARLVNDDALDADNSRFTVVPPLARIGVMLSTPGNFFLEKVLAANPRIALEMVEPDRASNRVGASERRAGGAGVDVIVCDGCVEPPGRDEATLLVAPRASPLAPAALAISTPGHAIAASLEFGELLVTPLTFPGMTTQGDVILRAGGQPVAVAYERDGRRIVELRLDLAAPDLALSTAFPVLIANAIDWLAEQDENRLEQTPGFLAQWRLPGLFASDQVSATAPDGRPARVSLQGRHLVIADTDLPGPYRVHSPAGEQMFVVNPVIDGESDLAVAGTEARPSSGTPQSLARPAFDKRRAAPVLLLLAFGLLAAEWTYRWKWEGRSS